VKAATVEEQESLSGRARESVTGWWGRARRFLSEVRNEMGRVTWPSRKEVYATTFVVILFSVVMGVYLWAVDIFLARTLGWVYRFFGAS
jgi:preprotein translocase subunit SecE